MTNLITAAKETTMMMATKIKKTLQNKHLLTCDYFSTVPSCLHFTM